MRRAGWCMAICLLLGTLVWAQAGQKAEQKAEQPAADEPAPHEQPSPEQRPTLGPAPAPSLGAGPRTANTSDSRKLIRIRSLYIERIDNALSDRLVLERQPTILFLDLQVLPLQFLADFQLL